MRGSQKVIDQLNKLLTGELTAADIYFIFSRMCHDWGYDTIAARFKHEVDDELLHANVLIDRILFLGGNPNVAARDEFEIKNDIKSMIELALDDEYQVAKNLKVAIKICEEESDYESRQLLLGLLKDTEQDHINFLEIQLKLIDKIGTENYIQSTMNNSSI